MSPEIKHSSVVGSGEGRGGMAFRKSVDNRSMGKAASCSMEGQLLPQASASFG